MCLTRSVTNSKYRISSNAEEIAYFECNFLPFGDSDYTNSFFNSIELSARKLVPCGLTPALVSATHRTDV